MIKFSRNSDFDFGIESVSVVNEIKTLIKRASARELLKFEKTANQTDLHVIAVGAYEGTGFNRNGDCFLDKDCKSNYSFFKKADRAVHRHHKNKKDDPKFGNIKAAAYNEPMKRIELIVGLDNDKCADIIQEQEKVGHTNWSMASKQAYDICSWCKHAAHSDEDRCEHIPANIGEINKQGEMCGMINPDPKWFEISYVRRPADRIGMSLQKMASNQELTPMLTRDFLQLYPGFNSPSDEFLISKKASDKRDLIQKLSEIEKHLDAVAKKAPTNIAKTEKMAAELIDDLRQLDPHKFFKIAADNGIILSPENFSVYLFGDRVKEAAVKGMHSHLSHIYTDLTKEGGEDVLHNEKFEPAAFGHFNNSIRNKFSKLATDYSLFDLYLKPRFYNQVIHKTAANLQSAQPSGSVFEKELAKQYAAYKLAALNYLNDSNKLTDDLLVAAVAQNR